METKSIRVIAICPFFLQLHESDPLLFSREVGLSDVKKRSLCVMRLDVPDGTDENVDQQRKIVLTDGVEWRKNSVSTTPASWVTRRSSLNLSCKKKIDAGAYSWKLFSSPLAHKRTRQNKHFHT